MLECVINVSEGQNTAVIDAIANAGTGAVLDVHRDEHHHRSVITVSGNEVQDATRAIVAEAVARIDLTAHTGAHPRIGSVDVVPFAPLSGSNIDDAISARDDLAAWAGATLQLPCFLYGNDRTLPQVRAGAFVSIKPDTGPPEPHPTAGGTAVGARPLLIAYNLWLAEDDLALAKSIAADLRSHHIRALGLKLGNKVQVSFNLVELEHVGPDVVFDAVKSRAEIERAELVGLAPASLLDTIPKIRWRELDLDESRTIEARLRETGLNGGRF